MQASELANACAQHMYANDKLSQFLNMEIKQLGEGSAVVTMTVKETMVNGHQTCHGGMIFSLADSAFAFAKMKRQLQQTALSTFFDLQC